MERFFSGLPNQSGGGKSTGKPQTAQPDIDPDTAAKLLFQGQQMLLQGAAGNSGQLRLPEGGISQELLEMLPGGQFPDNGRRGQEAVGRGALPPVGRVTIPLSPAAIAPEDARLEVNDGLVTLFSRGVQLGWVLTEMSKASGVNIITANGVDAAIIDMNLSDVPFDHALTAILSVSDYTWTRHDGIIYVTSVASRTALPEVQGRKVQIFPLDYVDSTDILPAVQDLLSPLGRANATASDEADNRKTQEVIIVEDLPRVLSRVAALIHQVDRPPRQVLIEVHILEVELKDDHEHGVDFEHMFQVINNNVTIETVGFASVGASPSFFASVSGGNLDALIQLLKSTTDVKTLASPKILVLNEQTASIQIGEQLGFRVTTTTETSTLESVDFLDVGVVLHVTPRISRDNFLSRPKYRAAR